MLNAGIPLPHAVTLPVLGIPTRFATNETAMLEIVEESFGMWSALGESENATTDANEVVHVRIVVGSGGSDDAPDEEGTPIRHEMSGDHRFSARSSGGIAESEPARRIATIRATRALVAERVHFQVEMLEATVLALLSCYDRHPLHAAALADRGHALLLAAPSGTGKSTLAYVCHAAGLDLLGDDHVRVQLAPTIRIWGWPGRVKLLAETAARMGLARAPIETANGKTKAVIDARRDVGAGRLVAGSATVCVLARDGGGVSLEPLSPDALAHALDAQLAPGFDRFPARWPHVVRALTERGGWRLNLSRDPNDALPLVREMLAMPSGGS